MWKKGFTKYAKPRSGRRHDVGHVILCAEEIAAGMETVVLSQFQKRSRVQNTLGDGVGREYGTIRGSIFQNLCHGVRTHPAVGIGQHGIHLTLKFVFINPEIIALTKRNKLTPYNGHDVGSLDVDFLGILIFCLINGADQMGIGGFEFPDNLCGIIGGSIVMDNDFKVKVCLLGYKALQTPTDVLSVIERSADYGNKNVVVHGMVTFGFCGVYYGFSFVPLFR